MVNLSKSFSIWAKTKQDRWILNSKSCRHFSKDTNRVSSDSDSSGFRKTKITLLSVTDHWHFTTPIFHIKLNFDRREQSSSGRLSSLFKKTEIHIVSSISFRITSVSVKDLKSSGLDWEKVLTFTSGPRQFPPPTRPICDINSLRHTSLQECVRTKEPFEEFDQSTRVSKL